MRYSLLESIAEFAADKLRDAGEWTPVSERHYTHFLDLITTLKPVMWGHGHQDAVRRLELEHDNLRGALRWSLEECDDPSKALLLGAELSNYWLPQGYFSEARDWLGRALQRVDQDCRTEARAYALQQAGVMALVQSDMEQAGRLLEESVSIRRGNGTPLGMANTLLCLGSVYRVTGDYERATGCVLECLTIYRGATQHSNVANALNNLGIIYMDQHALDKASACFEESLDLNETYVNRLKMAVPMANLGEVVLEQGDIQRARALHEATLIIYEENNNPPGIASARCHLAQVAAATGDYAGAGRLIHLGLQSWIDLGSKLEIVQVMELLASNIMSVALAASSASATEVHPAVTLVGASDRIRRMLNLPRDTRGEQQHKSLLARAQSSLSEEAFTLSWASGQSMSLDDAARLALALTAEPS
jgi:tetratricopeptide (TPR) repeat protein